MTKDYELIDCGRCEKLERFGPYCMIRPEPKAIWNKTLPENEWARMAHTRFLPGVRFKRPHPSDLRSATFPRGEGFWIAAALRVIIAFPSGEGGPRSGSDEVA